MRFIKVFLVAVALIALMPAVARETVRLDEGWHTWMVSAVSMAGVPEDTLTVCVPHNWDDYYGYRQLTHGNLHGTAMYVKDFSMAPIAAGQRAFLRFEGVGTYASIRLNGKDLGRHLGGRVSFTVDITEAVQTENILEVKCEHPDMICDMPDVCGGCSSEWGFSEGSQPLGIFRPVTLEITPDVRIEPFGVHVWHNEAADTLFIETEIRNYSSRLQQVTLYQTCDGLSDDWKSLTADIQPFQTVVIKEKHPLNAPLLWSHDDPFLYELQSSVTVSGQKDFLATTFGIRTLSWPVLRKDGDGRFFLNGEPFFINGTCDYEHILGGSHAFSDDQVRARVRSITDAGFNAFRDAHQPHNLLFQQLWDEQGILFWTQFSAHIWYDTPEFRENFKTQLRQWVKERRNCPSVVLWGLQNESVLPEDFARECCEIIREMDPTAATMRPITTCNGGVGTDWNVVQNWSGTYGGNLQAYGHELSQPSQLLNGEYGAWRTFGLHEAPGEFVEKGAYTEERFAQLLETKVRLAEAARDSVCGQFQWAYVSHDNPGRQQPEEAYRIIDRVGPVNYKGLLTPWEEPTDAWYMYQANYTLPEEMPMVHIVSHNWPQRFATMLDNADIEVYTNCDSVKLYNDIDNLLLGTEVNSRVKGTHLYFKDKRISYNLLYAVAYYGGVPVATDLIRYQGLPESPGMGKLKTVTRKTDPLRPAKGVHYVYRINCGGDDCTDTYGKLWKQDNLMVSHSWAQDFPGMNPYQASQRVVSDPICNTLNEQLVSTFRYGRQRLDYRFPLPDGEYRVELFFVEPWHTADGMRLFDVRINDSVYLHRLDIHAEAGHDRVLKKVIENVRVTSGQMALDFPEVDAGQAIVSAIAIAAYDRRLAKGCESYCRSVEPSAYKVTKVPGAIDYAEKYVWNWSWAAADTAVAEKLPAEMMPEDVNPHPSVNYLAVKAGYTGNCEVRTERKKECLVFGAAEAGNAGAGSQSVTWTFQTGLAQIYALRFNYRNLSGKDIRVRMTLRATDQREIRSAELTFSPNDRGWKVLSTTTGTYINAGTYYLTISAEDMEGMQIESLDVQ